MGRSRWLWAGSVLTGLAWLGTGAAAQEASAAASEFETPEAVVRALYDFVTVEAGTTPDWSAVRSLFLPEAVIVLRTTRTETTVFSVDGFVDDFVRFIERAGVERTGFAERIVRLRPWAFKDLAHVLVLYEATIPGSGRPAQQGIDSFAVVRKDGRWWIAAITNDIPDPANPVPPELAGSEG
jgi:hypothetical protein